MPPPGFRGIGPGGNLGVGNVGRGIGFDVDWDPSPLIVAAQALKFGMSIKSFREPLQEAVKKVVIPSIAKNFEVEGRPLSWEPLSLYTLLKREVDGFPTAPILERTGKLRRAATAQARWKFTRETATVGDFPSTLQFARALHEGTEGTARLSGRSAGKGKGQEIDITGAIPARPFMMIQDEDLPEIEEVFRSWLRTRALAAGLISR